MPNLLTRKAVRTIMDTDDNTEDLMYAHHYRKLVFIAKILGGVTLFAVGLLVVVSILKFIAG